MNKKISRILISAFSSSSGKTTFTMGLLRLLQKKGIKVSSYKCGPDYIDTMFHTKALGISSRNIDLFLSDENTVKNILADTENLAVIEGVMGFYDGIAFTDSASASHISSVTDTPCLLIVDVKGKSATLKALISGMLHYRKNNIKGIILNRISKASYPVYKNMIEAELPVKVFGYMPELENCTLKSRHLGLITAEEMADIILSMKDFLSRRVKGAVTRVEIEADTPAYIVEFLQKMVNFKDMDTQYIQGVIDLTFLFSLSSIMPNMQFPVHKSFSVSDLPENSEIFNRIKEKDIFFFRPYYSFSTVSKLIAAAAEDNDVLAIKMTLYRTNRDSSILASLVKAAKSGKQVSVVVELKARFDEERNIDWAKNLEDAGCIVTYGIAGLKIHAKCLLIVRREYESIKRYTHIATGNYNENTAALYTDVDLITSDDSIGRDAAQLFNYLMAYTEEQQWKALSVAPFNLRENLYKLFDNEIKQAKEGRKAHIVMKMNSLIDKDMIDKMYEASNAGVRIDLIVRGICGLKAGCKGFSSNIKVRSIIGRLLEHSRIFYFENAGNPRYFIASADMMPRNLNRRVELMAEINDEDFKNALGKFLDITLKDNMKAWQLTGDTFIKIKKTDDEEAVNSQEYFMNNRLI